MPVVLPMEEERITQAVVELRVVMAFLDRLLPARLDPLRPLGMKKLESSVTTAHRCIGVESSLGSKAQQS